MPFSAVQQVGRTLEEQQLVFLSAWGPVLVAVAIAAAVVAVVFAVWGYRRERPLVRVLLVGMRVLAVAAVLVMLFQPAIQLRSVTRLPNHVALLIDSSRSMALHDVDHEPSRLQRAMSLVARSDRRLDQWRRDHIVDFWSFDAEPAPLGSAHGPVAAQGRATHIRGALAGVRRHYPGAELAGVVLISDGMDNGSFGSGHLSPADRGFVERLGFPVHTIWVGRAGARDVAVDTVRADELAFVRNVASIEAELTVTGLDLDTVPVTLTRGKQVVATRELKVKPGVERYRVTFSFVPDQVGKYLYTVSTPLQRGEMLSENNSRSFIMQVIRDRIRVLQVCGRPSWDERFLRRLLERDPNIDLISFFILRTPASLSFASTRELSLIPFPTDELFGHELGSFDLVILQNFNYGPYGIGAYLDQMRRYVTDGGALAMVGGDLSFTSGGYAGTPLAEVLPVRLLPRGDGNQNLIATDELRLKPTPIGLDHPILQVGATARESRRVLGVLPSLAGVNRVAGASPGATVLAVHPSLRGADGQPMPVLAVRSVDRGRTMALTVDTIWRWAFLTVGEGGTSDAYDRFWHNAIRWLIRDPTLQYLRIVTQRDRIPLGTTARMTFRAYNPDYSPARDVALEYEIAPQDETAHSLRRQLTNQDGELHVEYRPNAPGAYRVRVTGKIGGRSTEAQGLFLVESTDVESREARARPTLLKDLSRISGGRFSSGIDELPPLKFNAGAAVRVNWRRDIELWNRPYTLVLVIFLLALEWLVRRRYGHF